MEKPAQWALVGAAWFLALTIAIVSVLAWRHFEGLPAAGVPAPGVAGSPQALPEGATAICPVTHEKVMIGPATPHVVYMDRVYYFSTTLDASGREPKRAFLMDPEFYVHPGSAPLPPIPAEAPADKGLGAGAKP